MGRDERDGGGIDGGREGDSPCCKGQEKCYCYSTFVSIELYALSNSKHILLPSRPVNPMQRVIFSIKFNDI